MAWAVDSVRHRLPHRQLVKVEVGAPEARAEDVAGRLAEGRNAEIGVRLEPRHVLQCGVAQGVDLGVLDPHRPLRRLQNRLPANAIEIRRTFVGEIRHDRPRVVLPARHRDMAAGTHSPKRNGPVPSTPLCPYCSASSLRVSMFAIAQNPVLTTLSTS